MIVFAMLHNDNSDQASSKQTSTRSHNPFQTTPNSFRQHHRRLQPTVSRLHPTPLFASEQQFGSDRRRRPRLSHVKRSAFSDGRRFYSERLLQLIPIPSSKSRDSFIDRQPFGDHSAAFQRPFIDSLATSRRIYGDFLANSRQLFGEFSATFGEFSATSQQLFGSMR